MVGRPSAEGEHASNGGARSGDGNRRQYDDQVGRYLTPRCLWMHATIIVLLPTFAWLTKWQLDRALGGNTLSWAYTFEWPLFGIYAIYVWWQLIHDQPTAINRRKVPPAAKADGEPIEEHDRPGWALSGGWKKNVDIAARSAVDEDAPRHERFAPQTPEEAAQLAAYNRYLAQLNAADASAEHR